MKSVCYTPSKKRLAQHATYPPLQHQLKNERQAFDEKKSGIDTFYISGFLHHEHDHRSKPRRSEVSQRRERISSHVYNQNHLRKSFVTKRGIGRRFINHTKSPYLTKKRVHLNKDKGYDGSRGVEQYFRTIQYETQASITIQLFWRRILALRRYHYMAQRRRAAITIQATFRGFQVRSSVQRFKKKLAYYVPFCQARLRRRIKTKYWNMKLKMMHENATLIQGIIRSFLAKRFSQQLVKGNAAMTLQMFYRGSVLRKKCTRRRRNNAAVKIQCLVRRIQAGECVQSRRVAMNEVAQDIQRCWKGHLARKLRCTMLRNRCLMEFRNRIKVLDTKLDYYQNELDKFIRRSNHDDIQSKFNQSLRKWEETSEKIQKCQHQIQELELSKSLISPTEIESGWDEEIDRSLVHEKQSKASLQLDALFTWKKSLYAYQRKLNRIAQKKNAFQEQMYQLRCERDGLREMLHEYERRQSRRDAAINYRKAIADEKRKWKVVFTTPSGKPRKKKGIIQLSSSSHSNTKDSELDVGLIHEYIDRIQEQVFNAELESCKAMLEPINKFQNYS